MTALDQSSERLSSDVSDDAIHDDANSSNGGGGSSNGAWDDTATGSGNGSVRRKRMRSSFKHYQLKIMRSYFQTNHNPDAKELREISVKTGLMTRVIQVSLRGYFSAGLPQQLVNQSSSSTSGREPRDKMINMKAYNEEKLQQRHRPKSDNSCRLQPDASASHR